MQFSPKSKITSSAYECDRKTNTNTKTGYQQVIPPPKLTLCLFPGDLCVCSMQTGNRTVISLVTNTCAHIQCQGSLTRTIKQETAAEHTHTPHAYKFVAREKYTRYCDEPGAVARMYLSSVSHFWCVFLMHFNSMLERTSWVWDLVWIGVGD